MERIEQALNYFDNGYNCAQSVLAVFAREVNLPVDVCLKLATAFGGGIARQQLTCGALSGAAMVISLLEGKGLDGSEEQKQATYQTTTGLFTEFENKFGSHQCLSLLENLNMRNEHDIQVINDRQLFKVNCRQYVSEAVALVENHLKSLK
jgi:C_GCAxxG_C_C family probable redox protein